MCQLYSSRANLSKSSENIRTQMEEEEGEDMMESACRLSPTSQSVKSHDSGFSDDKLTGHCDKNGPADNTPDSSPEFNIYSVQPLARHQRRGRRSQEAEVEASLGRICSLQAGLNLKLAEEPRSLHTRAAAAKQAFKADACSASKLIHFINSKNREKVLQNKSGLSAKENESCEESAPGESVLSRLQSPPICDDSSLSRRKFESAGRMEPLPTFKSPQLFSGTGHVLRRRPNQNSVLDPHHAKSSEDIPLMMSTPVRSSFRQRPRTIIGIEEAHTPVKVAPRARLNQRKRADRRRDQSTAAVGSGDAVKIRSTEVFQDNSNVVVNIMEESGAVSDEARTADDEEEEAVTAPESVFPCSDIKENLDPVYDWWRDLLTSTDAECMTYLQSKPITRDGNL